MNGAESLMRTARDAGIDVCFANPGTTEMPLVVALDAVSGIRPVLGLFEGVCTGAADGFGRMAGRPAMTLLHMGPGLANGLANLHNARRARTPVVNVVGDHSTGHLQFDSPLKSDIEALAAPVSHWVRTSTDAHRIGADVADAVLAAMGPPGQVATLIIPADLQSAPATGAAPISKPAAPPAPESSRVAAALDALRHGQSSALLVGGPACQRGALESAARIVAVTACRLFVETFPARMERGAGTPSVERLPYFPEQIPGLLDGVERVGWSERPTRWRCSAGPARPAVCFRSTSRSLPWPDRRRMLARRSRTSCRRPPGPDLSPRSIRLLHRLGDSMRTLSQLRWRRPCPSTRWWWTRAPHLPCCSIPGSPSRRLTQCSP